MKNRSNEPNPLLLTALNWRKQRSKNEFKIAKYPKNTTKKMKSQKNEVDPLPDLGQNSATFKIPKEGFGCTFEI